MSFTDGGVDIKFMEEVVQHQKPVKPANKRYQIPSKQSNVNFMLYLRYKLTLC